jgi:outer membrane protein OmpA-like peptidoglycan-associated protein
MEEKATLFREYVVAYAPYNHSACTGGDSMRWKRRPTVSLTTVAAIFLIASLISGCATEKRRWGACAVGGAIAGGVAGAGIGLGVANAVGRSGDNVVNEERGTATWASAIGGAAVGTVLGHYVCDPIVQPPPPPPRVAQAPPPPPPPAPPPAPAREKLVLRGVHFDFDKSDIRSEDAAVLDEAAATLKARPNVTVNVNGYCDAIGDDEYNLKLSQRRSESVVNYLAQQGIPASRLIPHGYGKTGSVATNDTDEGRAQNRRVELIPVGQ